MRTIVLILSVLLVVACDSSVQSPSSGMAQFSSEKSFAEKHEIPEKLINFQAQGEPLSFETPDGKKGMAYAIMAKKKTNHYLLVIHEWWGLNDHIKMEADQLAKAFPSANIIALDMYDGQVADTREKAAEYMQSVSTERAEAIINGILAYAGKDAQVATIGWCFGGGWSLKSSILAQSQSKACVMYYGMPVQNAAELANLQAPILGIFAKKDAWINQEVISKFEALTKATGKSLETHWFDADHAFANPSSPRFKEDAAQTANELSIEFLTTNWLQKK